MMAKTIWQNAFVRLANRLVFRKPAAAKRGAIDHVTRSPVPRHASSIRLTRSFVHWSNPPRLSKPALRNPRTRESLGRQPNRAARSSAVRHCDRRLLGAEAATITASEGGPPAACGLGGTKKAFGCPIGRNEGLFSRQTRPAGSRGTASKAGAKRPSVHYKHAFSRGGAIKGAECLHGLVQCVAMRD
jgi:hypothetical protein